MLSRKHAVASAICAALLCVSISAAVAKTPLADSVKKFVERSELAGAVMVVADKESVLATEAVGWANVEEKTPMETDSIFWIASQSKPITGAAFLMLVDEGKVALDDPVERYLPEFAGQMFVSEKSQERVVLEKPNHPVTVREILSHTSGLPFKTAMEEPTLDLYPLEARVRSYAITPLDFEPGTDYQYSNAGINTAGRIIEVVSGMSFEDFLQERLFDPLGMKDTTFRPTEEQVGRIADSYKPGPGETGLEITTISQLHYPLSDATSRYPMPAGGLFSTASDVSLFYRMLLNDGEWDGRRYLSESAIKQLTSRQTPAGLKNYGLGFALTPDSFGHAGAYSTNTTAFAGRGLILVWLVQHAGFPGNGKQAQEAFRNAAFERFSASARP